MFPPIVCSNCPLAVLWLWLAGRAEWIVATRSLDPMPWWFRWHCGAISQRNPRMVLHFKRTRLVKRQPLAPYLFQGTLQAADIQTVRHVVWIKPAWQVIPLLLLLVAVGLLPWMTAAAWYWPLWLVRGARQAWRRRR